MLDSCLVEQIVVFRGLAGPRVEDLFFDLGMNLQREANLLRKFGLRLVVVQLFVVVEIGFDLAMILFEDFDGIHGIR